MNKQLKKALSCLLLVGLLIFTAIPLIAVAYRGFAQ